MAARPLDTSTLGPIRIEPRRIDKARSLLADKVEARGPAYRNAADAVRAGFSNIWIEPALAAIAEVLRLVPEEAE